MQGLFITFEGIDGAGKSTHDTADRLQITVEDVIKPLERARFLDRDEVVGLFDDAYQRSVTGRRSAVQTRIYVSQVVADIAKYDAFLDFPKRLDKSFDIVFRTTQNKKRQPLGIFVADTRQAFEFVDQLRDRL